MPDLTPMTRQEEFLNGNTDLTPITRREHFYAGTESTLPEPDPITREEWFIQKYRGGGGDITVESLSVTSNGTYTAPSGKAYSPVNVNVPLPENAYLNKALTGLPADIATFNDGKAMPLSNLKVGIEAVQSGSGDPSPSNPRLISGWSSVKVFNDPVYGGVIEWNQLMPISSYTTKTANDVLITNNADGSFTLNGTATGNIYADIYTNFQNSLTANHVYMFVANSTADTVRITNSYGGLSIVTDTKRIVKYTSGNVYVALYVVNGTVVDNVSIYPQCLDLTAIFGETKAEEILAMEQAEAGSGVAYVSNLFPNTYYAYNTGTKTCVSAVNGDPYELYTIPFLDSQGQSVEVFGGSVDVVNGTMTLTHALADLPSLGWGKSTNTANIYFCVLYTSGANGTYNEAATNIMSNIYISKTRNSITNTQGTVGIAAEANALYIADGRFNDYTVTQFKEAVNDVQLLLPLATPITIPLQFPQVKALEGVNNIFADSGEVQELSYFSK